MMPVEVHVTWISGGVRPGGIWDHPSGNMRIIKLSAVAALPLPARPSARAASLLGHVAAGDSATFTRVGLLVGLFVTTVFLVRKVPRPVRAMTLWAALLAVAMLAVEPAMTLGERSASSFGDRTILGQMGERITSTLTGASLSLSNPFGMLNADRVSPLEEIASLRSTHHRYVYLALHHGPLAALAAVASVLRSAWRWSRTRVGRPYHYPIVTIMVMVFLAGACRSCWC